MDILVNILLFLHFFGLVLGMGSGMALSNATRIVTAAPAESGFERFTGMLARNGHIGLGLLWVTGLLMVWLRYGGVGAFSVWFWIKMVLVVVLSAAVGMGAAAYRKAKAGDGEAARRAKIASTVSGLSGIGIIFAAVFAFN